jgi:hypothetical protein
MPDKCYSDGAIAGISLATFVFVTVLGTLMINKCTARGPSTPSGLGIGGYFIDCLLGTFLAAIVTLVVGISLALAC